VLIPDDSAGILAINRHYARVAEQLRIMPLQMMRKKSNISS